MATIDATVGGVNANSFALELEVDAYFDGRLPLAPPWVPGAATNKAKMIMATRTLEGMLSPFKTFVPDGKGGGYYRSRRTWTGQPATTTQKLSWPRIGMYDRNGNAIPSNVIPQELKEAEAEFSGQLGLGDPTLNNDVIVQGLTSVRAGSVALTFKENFMAQVIPDAVWMLLPAGWFTDEVITPAFPAEFDVVSW